MKLHVHYCIIRNPDLSCTQWPVSVTWKPEQLSVIQSTFSSFILLAYLYYLKVQWTLPYKKLTKFTEFFSLLCKHLNCPNYPHHSSSNTTTASTAMGLGQPRTPRATGKGWLGDKLHTWALSCPPAPQLQLYPWQLLVLPWEPAFCSKSGILNCSLNPHTKLVTTICIKHY